MRLVCQQVREYTLCTDPLPTTSGCLALLVNGKKKQKELLKATSRLGVGLVRLPSSLLPFPSLHPMLPSGLQLLGFVPFPLFLIIFCKCCL